MYNNKDDLDKFAHAKYITIHELKVYDDTYDKNLVADIVPACGTYRGEWTVFLYNKIGETDNIYPITIAPESLRNIHFYSKNN